MRSALFLCFIIHLALFATAQTRSINEAKFISIGGVEQWVTIKGSDISKPVILLLHGGPGSVMSPYGSLTKNWEKEFVIVNWDQRGAGKTYGRNAPAKTSEDYWINNPLTITRMTEDGLALSEYLLKHLNKKKIILFGTSWGSVLGMQMAKQRPDMYTAYIGHSQVVNASEGLIHAYHEVYEMAKRSGNQPSVIKLEAIGLPPYDDAKNAGQLFRIIKKYEKEKSEPPPAEWWIASDGYNTEKDEQDRSDGDDYSFIHYMGHKPLGIKAMMQEIDFLKAEHKYQIPIFLVQGEHDILTSKDLTMAFFNDLSSPGKQYFLIPKAAHGINQHVMDTLYKILKELSNDKN